MTHDCNPDLAAGIGTPVHVLRAEKLEAASGDDLLEEVKVGISEGSVRESRDGCRTGPGDNGNEEQRPKQCTLDAVQEKESSDDTAN